MTTSIGLHGIDRLDHTASSVGRGASPARCRRRVQRVGSVLMADRRDRGWREGAGEVLSILSARMESSRKPAADNVSASPP